MNTHTQTRAKKYTKKNRRHVTMDGIEKKGPNYGEHNETNVI